MRAGKYISFDVKRSLLLSDFNPNLNLSTTDSIVSNKFDKDLFSVSPVVICRHAERETTMSKLIGVMLRQRFYLKDFICEYTQCN